jgi:hypothetical protein
MRCFVFSGLSAKNPFGIAVDMGLEAGHVLAVHVCHFTFLRNKPLNVSVINILALIYAAWER